MTGTGERRPLVFVVEDEPDLAALYARWLDDDHRVRVANDGAEALAALDDGPRPSVVVLDRQLPDRSGRETLAALRERGADPAVAMVTAVEPKPDDLSMAFDDYLVKPVAPEPLRATVSDLLAREALDDDVAELLALASKRALLEAERGRVALEEDPAYERLRERFDALWTDLGGEAALDEVDGHEALRARCREFAPDRGRGESAGGADASASDGGAADR